MVSVAEIGLDASRAERNLERLFALATKWEAILLIDEADVFLETAGADVGHVAERAGVCAAARARVLRRRDHPHDEPDQVDRRRRHLAHPPGDPVRGPAPRGR